jgi:hypothetical protein
MLPKYSGPRSPEVCPMKKVIPQISFGVLLLSTLIYGVGRWALQNPITDDTADWFLWSGGISTLVLLVSKIGGVAISIRKCINAGIACAIIFFSAFGVWGLFSAAGQKQFPEMAGLFPFYALLLAGVLLLLLVIVNLVWRRRLKPR